MSNKKNIAKRYSDLLYYCRRISKWNMGFEDKPYWNFMSAIRPYIKDFQFYNDETVWEVVDSYLLKDKDIVEITEENIEKMIEDIKLRCEVNSREHYLIVPLQNSVLDKDIKFDDFAFITHKEKEEMISQITVITGLPRDRITDNIEHIIRSRSKDFIKYNLAIVKIKNQTKNIDKSASYLAQGIIYCLKILNKFLRIEPSLFTMIDYGYEDNYHVLILSDDDWRCGSSGWWTQIECRIDLSFLHEQAQQENFVKLYNYYILDATKDDLKKKFCSSFYIFNKSLQLRQQSFRDNTIALIVLFASAEAIIAEGEVGKRIRLSTILPELSSFDGITLKHSVVSTVNDLYLIRNNFIHAGERCGNFEECQSENLDLLEEMLAQVLVKKVCDDKLCSITKNSEWEEYINGKINILDIQKCPKCGRKLKDEFLRCPYCKD